MNRHALLNACILVLTIPLVGCHLLAQERGQTPAAPTLPAIALTETGKASPSPLLTTSVSASPSATATGKATLAPTVSAKPASTAAASVSLPLTPTAPVRMDCSGDGKNETISVVAQSGMVTVSITDGSGTKATLSSDSDFVSAFLYRNKSGKACLLLSTERACDDYVTVIYRIESTSLTFQKSGTASGYLLSLSGSTARLFDYACVLGCWDAYRDYEINSSFALSASGDKLWHITGPNRQLIVKAPLSVKIKKNGALSQATLAKGTRLRVVATDTTSYLVFTLSDGREGTLSFGLVKGEIQIRGKPANDWFDGILAVV